MMNRLLTLVSLIAALCAPGVAGQTIEYARVLRPTAAQLTGGAPEVLSRPARIIVRGVSLADALTLLSDRARVPVAFSASLLPGERHRVDCSCETATVAEALDRLLLGTTLDYMEVHGQVVIFPRLVPAGSEVRLAANAAWPALNVDSRLVHLPEVATATHPARPLVGGVRGKVVEAGSERPLSGAQVSIVGTSRVAISNAAGDYVLLDVPDGSHLVRARLIGYSTVEHTVAIAAGQVVSADFVLQRAAVPLDEVVVTGTAGPVSRRALGNAITTIDAPDAIEKAVNTSVTELLQARAPGVTVLQSSGSPGTAANIRIRGITSLTASSEPVIYVDGIRIHSGAGGSFRNNWETTNENQTGAGGGQTASALDAINPEDIQSIEVIKGPAASTLYGADAASGVIQIITKRGRAGDQKLQWQAKFQTGQSAWGLDRRTNFTTCTAARIALAAEWPGCQGVPPGTVLEQTYLDQVLRDGTLRNASLSVSGGGQGYSFYAGLDDDLEEGIFTNSVDKRTSARANFAFYPSNKVDFTMNLAYSRTEVAFPSTDNGPNVLEAAWTYQPGRAPQPGQEKSAFAQAVQPERYDEYDNRLTGDRVVLGTTLTYRPFTWFRNRLTVGGDINARQANRYVAPNLLWEPKAGQMTQGAPRNNVYTFDYAGTMEHRLANDWSGAFTFGTQYTNQQYRNTVAQGTGLNPLVRDVSSATDRYSWDEFSEVKTLGLFAQQQVSWRDRLYLTGAVRVDNSSVFGEKIDQLYYPKFSAAYVLSEGAFLERYSWLDNLKLRLAWGQAGNAPNALAKLTTYGVWQSVDPETGAVVSALRLETLGNPEVKPERGSEIELGFDAALLGNRLGLEFTYYNKTTRDALMEVPLSESEVGIAGASQIRNVGEINNRGVELAISATPVQSRRLSWDSRLGLYTNRNELVDFGFGEQGAAVLLGVTTLNQRHVEGFPLGGFWVHDPVDSAGTWVAGPARYAGSSLPTREVSLANTFTVLGKLRLYALLDYKGGHYLLDQTEWNRCRWEVCEQLNDPAVSGTRKAQLVLDDLKKNDALYTQRADYIKVREVSLGYTLPPEWSSRFRADRIAVMLAAHNLGYLWKPHYKGLDPDVTFNGVNQPDTPGDGQTFGWVRMDLWTVPMLRRLTMSVDVSF